MKSMLYQLTNKSRTRSADTWLLISPVRWISSMSYATLWHKSPGVRDSERHPLLAQPSVPSVHRSS
jgi:hypothetical protein